MKICAAYIRVSTDDQLEYSPESQRQLIRDYAKKNDMLLPNEFIFEDEGISGRKADKRPGFQNMISTAKTSPQPFDTILVWKYSRFARNQEESIVYKSLLKKEYGIDVISVSEPIIDGPFGSLIERIIEWMDEYYSIRLSGEVRRGMTERVNQGKIVSRAAFGYTFDNGSYIIVPNEAEIVNLIFKQYLSDKPFRSIARYINELGVKTKQGGDWDARGIKYILQNPVYIGMVRWLSEGQNDYHNSSTISNETMLIQGIHEPIISKEMFEEVGKKLKLTQMQYSKYQRQEHGSKGAWLLQGLVKCPECGGTFTHSAGGLNCSRYVHQKCNKSSHTNEQGLEQLVIYTIPNDFKTFNFEVVRKDIEEINERAIIENRIKKEEQILARVKSAYENGIDTISEYRENKKACQSRIDNLKSKLSAIKVKPIDKNKFANQVKKKIKLLSSNKVSTAEKNQILRSFVDRIVYHKEDKSIDVYYYI